MPRTAILVAVLWISACASSRPGGAEAAMRDWMDALNALDEARIVAAFADDATAFFPVVKAERAEGKEAIAAVFRDYVKANTKRTNIVPEDLRVQQSGDLAVVTFNVQNPSAVSRRTFVWRRANGAWRIVHMHASNVGRASARPGGAG